MNLYHVTNRTRVVEIEFCCLLLLWLLSFLFFYTYGGPAFPDYASYLQLDSITSSESYFGEVVSWSILLAPSPIIAGVSSVDFFYFLVQIYILMILLLCAFLGSKDIRAMIIISGIFLPWMMTMLLRVGPFHFTFALLGLLAYRRHISPFVFVSGLIFIAPLFHDSGFLPAFIGVLALILNRIFPQIRFIRNPAVLIGIKAFLCLLAFFIVNFGRPFVESFIFSNANFLLARASYLTNEVVSNFAMQLYSTFFILFCFSVTTDKRQTGFNGLFVTLMFWATICLFAIAPTGGVRFSFFSLTLFIAFRAGVFGATTKKYFPIIFLGLVAYSFFCLNLLLLENSL